MFKPDGINAEPTSMAFTIPFAGFLTAEFSSTTVGDIKRLENLVEVFRVRKIKDKFLQCFGIFKRIFYGFIKAFYMEVIFKIFQVFYKEIKSVSLSGALTAHKWSNPSIIRTNFIVILLNSLQSNK